MAEFSRSWPEPGFAWGTFYSRDRIRGTARATVNFYLKPPEELGSTALGFLALRKKFPLLSVWLQDEAGHWERRLKDAVELDFALAEGELRVRQVRALTRSVGAGIPIAWGLVNDGVLTRREACALVKVEHALELARSSFVEGDLREAERRKKDLGQGVAWAGGAVSGVLAWDEASVWHHYEQGRPVIFVCESVGCDARPVLSCVAGVWLVRGSVLALEEQQLPYVVLPELLIHPMEVRLGVHRFAPGDWASFDGGCGRIFTGALRVVSPPVSRQAKDVLSWCRELASIDILVNAASVDEVFLANDLGACGVGLCRIEGLLLLPQPLAAFQTFLLALLGASPSVDEEALVHAGQRLTHALEEAMFDFFKACCTWEKGRVTVRLFDAPLSQLLRQWEQRHLWPSGDDSKLLASWMDELNPMHGLRGGRLAFLYSSFLRIQIRALLRAWSRVTPVQELSRLHLMIPGVSTVGEVVAFRDEVDAVAREESIDKPRVGAMLEFPRACLEAAKLAHVCDFLAFGTGDLTEATCGMSRYDAALSFLPSYLERGYYSRDPFLAIDRQGVGVLMQRAAELVKQGTSTFDLGMVGAQASDPESLRFCLELGLTFASLPVGRVALALVIAAHAALGFHDGDSKGRGDACAHG